MNSVVLSVSTCRECINVLYLNKTIGNKSSLLKQNDMATQEIKKATEAIKETAKEMITMGATGMQVADIIASKFGNAIARLIMVDIALDLGMKEEAKQYLARF